MSHIIDFRALMYGVLLSVGLPVSAYAQEYPVKPIRFLVPYPTGGAPDFLARIIGTGLTAAWKQPVVIENRPGANGLIATEATARAPKDGYTIQMGSVATHAINPALYPKANFDAIRDFAPVTRLGYTPLLIVAHPSVGATTVKELIALAKSKPGGLTYGSVGSGSAGHLAAELFKISAGVDLTHIPYKGIAMATTDLLSGQIDLTFGNPLNSVSHIKSGKLRGIGVSSSSRLSILPQIQAISESLPGYEVILWWGVFAPAGTPVPVVERLHAEIARVLSASDLRAKWATEGTVIETTKPDQFTAQVKFEFDRWARVVTQSGTKIE